MSGSPSAVARLLRAEIRKLTTTRVLLGLTIASVAFAALNVVLQVFLRPRSMPGADVEQLLQNPAYITNVIGSASSSSIFVLILGIIGMTGEYRHLTITSTFLASPRRARVLVAKAGAYGITGAILAVVTFACTMAVALACLATRSHAPIDMDTVWQLLAGITGAFAIYAILGICLGALIRNQVAAIIAALVWMLLVEALLTVFVDWIGKWLPGGALRAVMQTTNVSGQGGTEVLTQGQGALVLVGYAVALAIIASLTTMRRDIT